MAITHFQREYYIQSGDEIPFFKWLVQKRCPDVNSGRVEQSVGEIFSKERLDYERSGFPAHCEMIMVSRYDGEDIGLMRIPMVPNIGFDTSMNATMTKGYLGTITYTGNQMKFDGMIPASVFNICSIIKLNDLKDVNPECYAFCEAVTISRCSLAAQPFTEVFHSSKFLPINPYFQVKDQSQYTFLASIGEDEVVIAPAIKRWRAYLLRDIMANRSHIFQNTFLPEVLKNCKKPE